MPPPPPPPVDPTKLVSAPPPAPRPGTAKPPPLPRAAPRAAAPTPAAEPPRSRTGLLVGMDWPGSSCCSAVGTAFFVLRPKAPVADPIVQPVDTAPPVTVADAPRPRRSRRSRPPPSQHRRPRRLRHRGRRDDAPRVEPADGQRGSASGHCPPATAPPARDAVADMLEAEPPRSTAATRASVRPGDDRSDQGSSNSGSFGTNRRFRAREKFPRDVTPAERKGVFVMLNVIHYQALHRQRTGRYGTFKDVLPRQVGTPNSFDHAGYRFDMTVESDAFKVVATPLGMGMRGFVADDSGFVRYADE